MGSRVPLKGQLCGLCVVPNKFGAASKHGFVFQRFEDSIEVEKISRKHGDEIASVRLCNDCRAETLGRSTTVGLQT